MKIEVYYEVFIDDPVNGSDIYETDSMKAAISEAEQWSKETGKTAIIRKVTKALFMEVKHEDTRH